MALTQKLREKGSNERKSRRKMAGRLLRRIGESVLCPYAGKQAQESVFFRNLRIKTCPCNAADTDAVTGAG